MSENRHVPVLLNETIEALAPAITGPAVLVDCTLGGAGHTRVFLERFENARVLGCDVDASAIGRAKATLATEVDRGRLEFFHGNFSKLMTSDSAVVATAFGPPWSAVLADLGYSSNQLETGEYGLSFLIDGPLDMRLGRPPRGQTAWALLLELDEENLAEILAAYGEITGARKFAHKIKTAIDSGEVTDSTVSLASFVERISGWRGRHQKIHPATQLFQALRIAVNDELRALDQFLEGVILKVRPGGRIAIIAFHSLEDRIVKRWGQKHCENLRAVTKKPITAGEAEVRENPRARSAKLRVYERIA